jgi:hypothetical protein
MKCPKEGCGFELEEWGMDTQPVYECPVHGRIRIKRKPVQGLMNPVINWDKQ